jgi:hypothetical protein
MKSSRGDPAPCGRQAAGIRRKRSYNVRLVKRDLCYAPQEIAELFGIHVQAVRRWIKGGLQTIDERKPFLVHGSDLIQFLTERQSSRKRRCRPDQLFCCHCRLPKRPRDGAVSVQMFNETQLNLAGRCEECRSPMNRVGSVGRLDEYRRIFVVKTIAPPRLGENASTPVIRHLEGIREHAALQSQK